MTWYTGLELGTLTLPVLFKQWTFYGLKTNHVSTANRTLDSLHWILFKQSIRTFDSPPWILFKQWTFYWLRAKHIDNGTQGLDSPEFSLNNERYQSRAKHVHIWPMKLHMYNVLTKYKIISKTLQYTSRSNVSQQQNQHWNHKYWPFTFSHKQSFNYIIWESNIFLIPP